MANNVRNLDVSLTAPQAEFLKMDCRYPLFTGGVGSGKALRHGEKVLTPIGFKNIEDMVVGNEVITPDNKIEKVIAVYPQGVVDIYRVYFQDGNTVDTCGNHLWSCHEAERKGRGKRIKSTLELIDWINKGKRPIVPLTDPIEFNHTTFPIESYTLGVLLGDGSMTTTSVSFTTADDEICQRVLNQGYSLKEWSIGSKENAKIYGIHGVQDCLRNLKLLGCGSSHKFIPDIYKKGSVGQRFDLIQGLMDTDGYASLNGSTEYCTTSKQLSTDVKEILNSLGFTVTVSTKTPICVKSDGTKVNGKLAYILYIRGKNQKSLFSIARKIDRTWFKDVGNRIVKIELIDKDYASCISISGDGKLFLTTNYIVTHNSFAMIVSAFIDATHSPDATIAIYEPTFSHIRNIAVPKMMEFLGNQGIDFKYNKNEHNMELDCKQIGNFLFMSYDNPELIVGFESYRSHIDELDVVNEAHAQMAWNKIIARNRQNPKGLPESLMKWNQQAQKFEPKNKVSVYSTPEGFKFTHKIWGTNKNADGTWKNPEYQYTQVSSSSNPTLSEDYIQSLKDTYPGPLVDAYIEGKWVNMASGTVYNCYDRVQHASTETIRPGEQLYIGCDFNVTNQAATIWVKRDGGLEWHAVAELTGMYDTPEMINIIQSRWQSKGHKINVYPDASGKARSTTNASTSDIALLKGAGFMVWARSKNPPVRDRVQATNNAFSKNKLKINDRECPTVAKCFEQQSYDANGIPDKKSGFDHQNDASTYPIAYEMMISRPLYSVPIKWVS